MRRRLLHRIFALNVAAFAGSVAVAAGPLETTLYSFCAATNCDDGEQPVAGLLLDSAGNLYGTTRIGGANHAGTVFALAPDGSETVLHSFGQKGDGAEPMAGLSMDGSGNLYGTTSRGGAHGQGTVFKLAPDGTETVLYSFTGGADGSHPNAGVTIDRAARLYGTTSDNSALHVANGTAFQLVSNTNGWTLNTLVGFSKQTGNNPFAGLVIDKHGNLFGTTSQNGSARAEAIVGNGGTVFELQPGSAGWSLKILYAFCSTDVSCKDGNNPNSAPVLDEAGNLYGATLKGGTHSNGALFKITKTGTETTVYNFCSQRACADGGGPIGDLALDAKRNLYGATQGPGNPTNQGTVFKVSEHGQEATLYSFCPGTHGGCTDGSTPFGGVIRGAGGALYGTTSAGGAHRQGVVFVVSP